MNRYGRIIMVIGGFGLLFVMGIRAVLHSTIPRRNGSERNNGKILVAASLYPMYFFAKEIGGDKATVINITPSGVEPHDFEPSTGDVAAIERANLLIVNGAIEPWGEKIRHLFTGKSVIVVVAGDGVMNAVTQGGTAASDPHVWLSPPLALKEVDAILNGFLAADPANRSYYRTNADNVRRLLAHLDSSYRNGLSSCLRKDFVTSHAAFGYLAATYGLTQVPIAGVSPDAEPSLAGLARLVQFARNHQVSYIFFEHLVSPKLAQTIAREVGAETMVLDPIEGISDDELAAGETYVTKMEENLTNLKVALSCQ